MQTKRILCFLLCLTMLAGLMAGCGNQDTPDPGSSTPPVGNTPSEDSIPSATQPEREFIISDSEIAKAMELIDIPAGWEGDLLATADFVGFEQMMKSLISLCDAAALDTWNTNVSSTSFPDRAMLRDDGLILLMLGAEALGFNVYNARGTLFCTEDIVDYDMMFSQLSWDYPYCDPGREIKMYFNTYGGDEDPIGDVVASAVYWMQRRMDISQQLHFLDCDEELNFRFDQPLTRESAIKAVVRLYNSAWLGYEIPDIKYEATAIQSQAAQYVPIAEVGTYNRDIIPDELVANVDLPEAGNGKVPVWNGYILETKGILNQTYQSESWKKYTAGLQYFNKFEVEHVAELGFNCIRVMYGLSFLSNPDDIYSINISELEQLDELLSWCLENNLHLMISIMGMPGKANTSVEEEEVGKNDQIFTDPAMTVAYQNYMEMLAMRYADIPSKALSFELLAEATAPDMDTYEAVLASVAEVMWEYDSSKILVANDLMKMVPERLAEIGCCLSLHNHFYSINGANLTDWYGVGMSVTYWPMASVVEAQTDGQTTKLYSEEGFVETTLSLSYTYFNLEPVLYADGVQISWENATGRHLVYDAGELHAKIPDGTKELTIVVKEEMGVSVIAVAQGKQMSYILPIGASGIYLDAFAIEYEFTITSDGKVLAANEATEQMQSWQFMYDHSISKFVECAEKNGVSFIMTEIGTDTQTLSVEDYIAYHTEQLELLDKYGIGWMYNCIHNILAPPDLMWQGAAQGFTVTPIEGTPYFENREITDMLVSFAQQDR